MRVPEREDAGEVAAMIRAADLTDNGTSDMSVEELLDDWYSLDLAQEAVAVVAPDGTIVGYADVVNRSFVSVSVYGYVHPDFRGLGIGKSLISWGERWTRERIPHAPEGSRVVVQHYINDLNEPAQRLLRSLDYAPVRGVYVMETELHEAPPQPLWPEGVTVRTFTPGKDERPLFEAVEDAFRDMWGRPRGTLERFISMTRAESFDPTLWFLAVDGDEIAGATLCKMLAGEGWIHVVGVRRPWRNRGLGLALLRHALAEYHRRDVRKVALSVDAESITGAPRLYGRAGMHVRESYAIYLKELRPGRDLGARS